MKTTAKALKAALHDVRDGLSVSEAARTHGVAYTTLWKYTRREGITPLYRRDTFRAEVCAYYKTHTLEDTAMRFGVGKMTVVRWLKQMGLTKEALREERRADALALIARGRPRKVVAAAFNVHEGTLCKWLRMQERAA